jgi:hypothetical protein
MQARWFGSCRACVDRRNEVPRHSGSDLNQFRLWVERRPEVPDGGRNKDFGSFKICGSESYPKTFLLEGNTQKANSSN